MIKCPRCDYKYDLVGDEANKALVAVIKIVGSFGPHTGLMLEYALVRGAGKPIQGKELKLLRIMEGLEKLWTEEAFSFNGKTYRISKSGIAWCLKTVCDKTHLAALQNDNYLKQIMVSVAEKEAVRMSQEQEAELIRKERGQRGSGLRPLSSKLIADSSQENQGKTLRDMDPEERKKIIGVTKEYLQGGTPHEK